jgi:hypothetical protein
VIAVFLFLVPVASQADTTPPPLFPPAITAAIEAIAAQPDQCPNVEAIQSLVDGARDWAGSTTTTPEPTRVPAVAAYAALRLQANGGVGRSDASDRESQCGCVEKLSQALAPVDPARAADVRQAFADAFPKCDKRTTESDGEGTMQAPAAPYGELPEWKNLPAFGIFGDPTPLCRGDCSAVEPPPAHAASRTAL